MVLVTGGTGLLGSYLLYELLNSGGGVRAIKRKTSNTDHLKEIFSLYCPSIDAVNLLFSKIEWVDADLLDIHSIMDAMDGISEVYHCGAIVSFHSEDREFMLKVNSEGTANIVNSALEKDIRKLIYVSSIAALGRAENNDLTDENSYWKTSKKNTNYAISKYFGETEVWRGINEGLKAVIVNPSVILGPGYWHNGSSELFKSIYNGLYFYPSGVNGFVDVRDVAGIMIKLMKSEIKNERFIVSSENLSYNELCEIIAKYLKVRKPSVKAYRILTELYWVYEKFKSSINGTKPFITREIALTANEKFYYSNKRIKDTLKYEFIPIKDTIKLFTEQYIGHLNKKY
jgi:dihydroflavonol-4-reductase